MCACVCMFTSTVCMLDCAHVCMFVCLFVCMFVRLFVCLYVCLFLCLYVCLYVCMYVCMYVCLYVVVCSFRLTTYHEGYLHEKNPWICNHQVCFLSQSQLLSGLLCVLATGSF